MTLLDEFVRHALKGKDIYVVDDHHRALAAWACVRRTLSRPPNLITIDHHTDIHEAFLGYSCKDIFKRNAEKESATRDDLISKIDWRSDSSVLDAIAKLKHDEHINAATLSGILDNAFCIQLSDSDGYQSIEQSAYAADKHDHWPTPPTLTPPIRPMTYQPSRDRIYVIPAPCYIGCTAKPHNDECLIRQSNEIIEAHYLEDQLTRGSEISRCVGLPNLEAAPYILDIDLDAFHSRKAIHPDDPKIFHRLIRNAQAITIATEEDCVNQLWLDELDRMNSSELLAEVMLQVGQAI